MRKIKKIWFISSIIFGIKLGKIIFNKFSKKKKKQYQNKLIFRKNMRKLEKNKLIYFFYLIYFINNFWN